jgi:hypothetical protein
MDPRIGRAAGDADPGYDGELPTPVHAYAAAGTNAPHIVRIDDQVLLIECRRCASRSPITAHACGHCGLPFTLDGMNRRVASSRPGSATPALVLGILSIPASCAWIGLAAGIPAIVLGIYARSRPGHEDDGCALAGIILGILACAIFVVALLANL